ncbi:MAG: gluconate 2-dehydrogenase subunit 3 family protein [Bryobacterales bacterium]|nr:gluconate 2-dehydrogenase subunit 3 family protein [Bryobacterales bacterium]
MPSRRDLLATAAALPVLGEAQTAAPAAYTPRVFTAAELDLIRDLADVILPRTDTPGAADAKVHLAIDRVFSGRPAADVAKFRAALAAATRDGAPAGSVIARLHAQRDPFFKQLKDLTIDAYYTSREGLAQELGWHGYVALPEFKGCTHKEHQGD